MGSRLTSAVSIRSATLCMLLHSERAGCGTQQHQLNRMLRRDGWEHFATKDSHQQFTHPD